MKILITDAENRKTFDIINIVLRYYLRRDILITSNKKNILLSILYSGLQQLRTICFEAFEIDLKTILSSVPVSEQIVYIPIEEAATLYFYRFLEKNEDKRNKFLFLLPPVQSFAIARDKYMLNIFCMENNIAVPSIVSKDDVIGRNEDFKPLICKPRLGTGSKGIKIIKSREELDAIALDDNCFLQHFIGNGITVDGGFYLIYNGKLQSFYSHQRIRTYPPEGGVSIFSKTTHNDRIKIIGERLLQQLNWSGWAMIEFIYDQETDNYLVIEINPRAWGSILLSEINQLSFINKYIRLSAGMEIEELPVNYNTYIRWLIPWDVVLYIRSRGRISGFWKLNRTNTGYIGFTYSNLIKSFLFILFSVFNMNNIKKIFVKAK